MTEKQKHKQKEMGPAQKYLTSIQVCDRLIDCKIREREQLYELITRITPVLKQDVVSGGGGQDDKKERWVDLAAEIDQEIDRYVNLKREATELLQRLENPKHYEVLHRRYVLYHTFELIATELDYTYRGVCYLHGRALQAFGQIMDEQRRKGLMK